MCRKPVLIFGYNLNVGREDLASVGADRLVTVVLDTLDALFESFQLLLPYDRVGYSVIDNRSGMVVAQWARSKTSQRLRLKPGYQAPLAGSSLAKLAATGQPRVINDLVAHLTDFPESKSTRLMVDEGIRSSLTCPVRVR